MAKKRHHFIPKAYLKSFCDEEGKVCVYRKDDPSKEIRQSPDAIGFHKYYYSQPLPDGGRDHDKLEDLFSECESKWPPIMERLGLKENVNDCLGDIFAFIALQRARVPAARDATEAMLADQVKAAMRHMDAAGKLPPPPKGFEDILDHVNVAIDPHMSIHAMVATIQGIEKLLKKVGIGALHNTTDVPFLTSDNPVIWFDPSVPEDEMRPYTLSNDGPITLLFPVASNLMIYGGSSLREQFARDGFGYGELSDLRQVKMMNARVCRFAYESVFAAKDEFRDIVTQYADESPVVQSKSIPAEDGEYMIIQNIWGQRKCKPKWKKDKR